MTFLLLAITCALFGGAFALLATNRPVAALATALAGLVVAVVNGLLVYF